ncbi:hypothetical protein HYH03_001773 [Edaphochlamys debaryana]|uniref:PHD-type domain-containing protein n=1 Tax=Edaphochlamys debaryana TaxID=47281 RepID=A0A835YCJ5_9CHLO|nr:hypothetical protein HYH03_001773 [Edaphochlamys debaryana]|eukprot:KAG2500193.1 hypothetical protein HYH03_001773 [Edaphochlamys debaryana]
MPPRGRSVRSAGLSLPSDLSEATFGAFLRQLGKQKPKGGVDGIPELSTQRLGLVCEALERGVQLALQAAGPDPEADEDQELEGEVALSPEEALLTLCGAAMLALDLLARGSPPLPETLLGAAYLLHEHGLVMNDMPSHLGSLPSDLQDAVLRLGMAWWEKQHAGYDMLVGRMVPFALHRAVRTVDKAKVCHVHTCYAVREVLELLDFDDESINDTKRLLLHAAMHPAFLRSPEGRRFVAYLFRLHPQMTNELAAIVRNQIQSGQRFALEAYGEILFRAWRDTVGPCAAEVEAELQALMQAAILASTPALAAAIRTVLDGLHKHRHVEKRLDPALVRLYDPILPRAFGAANAEVRRNACNLLVAAFPIIDPEAETTENDARLTHQLGLLLESLADPCPAVREAAVGGCAHVLNLFWEIVPAATSAKMIGDMTGKLAFDGSSRAVRVAVLRGLRALIDNANAQPVLKKALPHVAPLLHDPDAAVREALAELLVGLSGSRGLHFWAVVPPEQLMEAMASDEDAAVVRKITRVLVPSLCPNAEAGAIRLVALLRSHPDQGAAFCRQLVSRFLPDHAKPARASPDTGEYTASLPSETLIQLAQSLASHLLSTAPGISAARDAPAEQAPKSPPPKRSKGAAGGSRTGRNGGGGGGATAAGKKRSKKRAEVEAEAEVEAGEEAEAQQAADAAGGEAGAAAAAQGAQDEDVVKEDPCPETEATWVSILAGLAALAEGLGAAVTVKEELAGAEAEAALPGDCLGELLRAAEEHVRRPEAVRLALRLACHFHFTGGALRLRQDLFNRMAAGMLPGMGWRAADGEAGPASASWSDAELMAESLKTLATGNNAPRVAAMLSAALGVREPQPLRKPVPPKKSKGRGRDCAAAAAAAEGATALEELLTGGGEEEEEDEVVCQACKKSAPDDSLLLCDGCDAPCHTHCLSPPLAEVPESDYFCHHCEAQLQALALPPAAAGRCVCLLLHTEEGRELLCAHDDFPAMVEALRGLAEAEAEAVFQVAVAGGADSANEADSSAAAAGADGSTSSAAAAAALGDPWGSLSRYCRAAVHRTMVTNASITSVAAADGSAAAAANGEPSAGGAAPTPGRTPFTAAKSRRGAATLTGRRSSLLLTAGPSALRSLRKPLPGRTPAAVGEGEDRPMAGVEEEEARTELGEGEGGELTDAEAAAVRADAYQQLVNALDFSAQTATSLAEAVMQNLDSQIVSDPAACTAGLLAALQYVQGVLRVVHVVRQAELFHMASPESATVIAALCAAQARLARAAAIAAAAGGSSTAAPKHQQAAVSEALLVSLAVSKQLAEAIRHSGPGTGSGSGSGEDGAGGSRGGSPSGRRRLSAADGGGDAGADGDGDEPQSSQQQLEAALDAAAAAAHRVDRRESAAAAGGAGGGAEPQVLQPRAALERLATALMPVLADGAVAPLLTGAVRVAAADLVGELLAGAKRASSGGWLASLCGLLGSALCSDPATSAQLADALRRGAAASADEDTPAGGTAADGGAQPGSAVRGVRGARGAQGSALKRAGSGNTPGPAAEGGCKAQKAAAAAATLTEVLREAPGAGTLASVLVRVCVARKAHGRAMQLLAPLAAKALGPRRSAAPADLDPAADDATGGGRSGTEAADARLAPALGAAALLALCRAAGPPSDPAALAQAAAGPSGAVGVGAAARRGKLAGRCAALAQEAAAQAVRAEVAAEARALGVLRAASEEGRALRPIMSPQGSGPLPRIGSGGGEVAAGEGEAAAGPRVLARLLVASVLA